MGMCVVAQAWNSERRTLSWPVFDSSTTRASRLSRKVLD